MLRIGTSIRSLTAALADPARAERTAVAVLAGYVVVWTLYAVIAKWPQDVHFDMAELADWSRHPQWGYAKHPPLPALVVWAWSAIFPMRDWSLYLLASSFTALGLWTCWRISARYLDPDKRVLGLALLMLTPLLTFHVLKFNANVVLITTSALCTLFFLRSFENSKPLDAALAGVFAAAAMLGKYWAIILLISLALSIFADRRWKDYVLSSAPWITAAAGFAIIGPHIHWLVVNDFAPFDYALGVHGRRTVGELLRSVTSYASSGTLYLLLPLIAVALLRPARAAVKDMIWPEQGPRRQAAVIFWVQIFLPLVIAATFRTEIVGLWIMSALIMMPVVLLSSPRLQVNRDQTAYTVMGAVAFAVLPLLASPAVAYVTHKNAKDDSRGVYSVVAREVAAAWQAVTPKPLRVVAGSWDVAYGVTFYLPSRASALPDFARKLAPWIEQGALRRDGLVIICAATDERCLGEAKLYVAARPQSIVSEPVLARTFLGRKGAPQRFWMAVVPPAQ